MRILATTLAVLFSLAAFAPAAVAAVEVPTERADIPVPPPPPPPPPPQF
jgi:hypothetical protein